MKSLLIIRHAKSSWDLSIRNDFDRPLNQRGHHDAPMMAERLLKKDINIDAFVSSTANRAFTTAAYFAAAYGLAENKIVAVPSLYHAQPNTFFEVVTSFDNNWNTVAVFSHNPGITAFVNELTNARIDNMPTCGIFGATIFTADWSQFADADKSFWFFDYPKA